MIDDADLGWVDESELAEIAGTVAQFLGKVVFVNFVNHTSSDQEPRNPFLTRVMMLGT